MTTKGKWIAWSNDTTGKGKVMVEYAPGSFETIVQPGYTIPEDQAYANAQAIAAVPDMIEVLKEVYELLPNIKPSEQIDILHRVSVALAKAGIK